MKIPTSQFTFRLLLALMLLMTVSAALPGRAQAQANSEIVLENVVVDVWPEYDRPSVLVMYHISLSSSVVLPADIVVRIPADATLNAVAMDNESVPYNLDYETRAAGQWIEILFQAPVQQVRVEFYDPFDRKEDVEREYTYTWLGDYPVNNLAIQIQQPPTATEMEFLPTLNQKSLDENGITYYGLPAGNVTAGTNFDLVIRYNKPDEKLTYELFQPVQPNQPINDSTAGRVNMAQWLPWIIVGLGLALIIGGVIWYIVTGRAPAARPASRRRHAASPRPTSAVSSPAPSGDAVFCSQCGKKAGPGDTFCRSCGTRLR